MTLNADAGTEQMANALKNAASDLEELANENLKLRNMFQNHGWNGLDALEAAQQKCIQIGDVLIATGEKIGVGGQIVRDALLQNNMITHASKESLTQS